MRNVYNNNKNSTEITKKFFKIFLGNISLPTAKSETGSQGFVQAIRS